VQYRPITVTIDSRQGTNCWLTMVLHEGKNREIKRLLQHLGLHVTRLLRTGYGPFAIGKLARGAVEEVPARTLREVLPGYFEH
jgi:23S rRNA pseudouridine2605 synthase